MMELAQSVWNAFSAQSYVKCTRIGHHAIGVGRGRWGGGGLDQQDLFPAMAWYCRISTFMSLPSSLASGSSYCCCKRMRHVLCWQLISLWNCISNFVDRSQCLRAKPFWLRHDWTFPSFLTRDNFDQPLIFSSGTSFRVFLWLYYRESSVFLYYCLLQILKASSRHWTEKPFSHFTILESGRNIRTSRSR